MTSKEQLNVSRSMAGSLVAKRGFASQRASCLQPVEGSSQLPAARPESPRARQNLARAAASCRPATKAQATRAAGPAPIWMAALFAAACRVVANGQDRAIQWACDADRATYTNLSAQVEIVQPLGVQLRGGDTLAVSWMPGDTAYTLEVSSRELPLHVNGNGATL